MTRNFVFKVVSRVLAVFLGSISIVLPILFLFLWGVYVCFLQLSYVLWMQTAVLDPPASVGVFVICIGLAGFCMLFGLLYWHAQRWRMQRMYSFIFLLTGCLLALSFVNDCIGAGYDCNLCVFDYITVFKPTAFIPWHLFPILFIQHVTNDCHCSHVCWW